MNNGKSNLIGELIMYNGKSDTENWVLCDGKERDNTDKKYDELINMEIGERKDNMYIPPDYNTMSLVSIDKSDNDIVDLLSKQVLDTEINFDSIENSHILFDNGRMLGYNVCFRSKMTNDETELRTYLSNNPDLVVTDIENIRDQKQNSIVKKVITWAICYKNID